MPVEHIKGFAVGTSIVLVMADMYALFPFLQVLWHLEESVATTAVSASPAFAIPSRCVCVCRGVDKFVRVRGLGCC